MIICGIKLTHDSSISIIEDDELKLCIELEKINNNNRFKIISSLDEIAVILRDTPYPVERIDQFVIDGWVGEEEAQIRTRNGDAQVTLPVAPYQELHAGDPILKAHQHSFFPIGNNIYKYVSYKHVSGHILSAYCTSPFAKRKESSYILVWDGGMYPRLYFYDQTQNEFRSKGPLFYFGSNIYSIFAQHFGPFKINENVIKDELSIAGKVMAYVAYGKVTDELVNDLELAYTSTLEQAKQSSFIPQYPYLFTSTFLDITRNKPYYDEDIISSFHFFIQRKLLMALTNVSNGNGSCRNLCIAGGAGLNIKWNSAIRSSNLFDDVWVPPFPNDSGSSIGMALCGWFNLTENKSIKWDIYSGPSISANDLPGDWQHEVCDMASLAKLLYESNEPVIFLNEKAELGPRALGNRSILASPLSGQMKDQLNYLKIREYYRPIAPVCIEERAVNIFSPGSPDPFMLFEHQIQEEWRSRIPAVAHADHTARLQTVNAVANPLLYELLAHFEKLSGVPVLCNTSANFKGSGFFPDLFSASRWGKTNYIWCNGMLYTRNGKPKKQSIIADEISEK